MGSPPDEMVDAANAWLTVREELGDDITPPQVIERAQYLPRTKLWGTDEEGYVVVLECDCGVAVYYPGHPDDRTEVRCDECGRTWKVNPATA